MTISCFSNRVEEDSCSRRKNGISIEDLTESEREAIVRLKPGMNYVVQPGVSHQFVYQGERVIGIAVSKSQRKGFMNFNHLRVYAVLCDTSVAVLVDIPPNYTEIN